MSDLIPICPKGSDFDNKQIKNVLASIGFVIQRNIIDGGRSTTVASFDFNEIDVSLVKYVRKEIELSGYKCDYYYHDNPFESKAHQFTIKVIKKKEQESVVESKSVGKSVWQKLIDFLVHT